MPNTVTTDEQTIKLKLKVVVPVVAFLLVASNLATRFITVQDRNAEDIKYNDEAHRRRVKTATMILKLELENERLHRTLKNCIDEK